jgi:hypothetical protein
MSDDGAAQKATCSWAPHGKQRRITLRRCWYAKLLPSPFILYSPYVRQSLTLGHGTIIAANKSCYCVAILLTIAMRDGIFSFYVRSGEKAVRAIALVENDSIKGFNRSHIYSIERLKYCISRLRKDRNTNWRVKVMEHSPLQGFSMRGFPAKLEGEEGEEQFWFEGGSDADRRVRVEIQGAWLHNLPWDRATTR